MRVFQRFCRIALVLCAVGCAAVCSVAQQPATRSSQTAYDISKDVSIQGTVLSYTENSKTPPIGTHVLLQTPSGKVDVHLGNASLLHLAKLTITPGANVRFVGQTRTVGSNTIFLARLVQVGTQILAVRSSHGMPLSAAGFRAEANKAVLTSAATDQKGGAR